MAPTAASLPVLLVHHVGPARPGTLPWLTLPAERLRRQLAWLCRHGYRTARIADVVAWATGAGTLPARSVLITFDDGYADLAETAFPLLRAAQQTATVFVVTGLLGEHNSWDAGAAGHRLLDAEAVRRWSREGIDFGAHTRSHPRLAALGEQELAGEVAGSRRDLEALIERPVRAFAYPYGAVDERVRRVVAASFDIAFTITAGVNRAHGDPLALRRTMVTSADTACDLALRLRLGRSPLAQARERLGDLRRRRT